MGTQREHILIDPPVSPFSTPSELRAWIKELKGMDQRPEVLDAIRQASEWLERAK